LRCQVCSEGELADCSTQVARHRKMPARPVLIEDEVECTRMLVGLYPVFRPKPKFLLT